MLQHLQQDQDDNDDDDNDDDDDDDGFIYQRYDTYKVCSNLGFKKEDLQSAFAKNNSKLIIYILTFLNDFVKIVLYYFLK
jgi:hypothetical protein